MPSDTVSNGTVIPSATRTSTADAVVGAGQSTFAAFNGGPLMSALASVSALLPSTEVDNATVIVTPSSPPSTATTTMLPSEIPPSDAPALSLSYKTYYSNSLYVTITAQSTSMTLASSSSVNGAGGVTNSTLGGVATPTQAQGAGVGGASGGATPLDYSGAETHRVGVGMGLVMGILGVVFGSLGAL